MRVLVAPDKFKGAATAAQVGAAIAAGLRDGDPTLEVEVLPIADGGDGTVDAAIAAGFAAHGVRVRGPVGDPHDATIALQARTAIVELANTCGVALLPHGVLRPLDANTGGLGDAIGAALDHGAHDLILAVGGSASTDAGLGALLALGARVLDGAGRDVPPGAGSLGDVSTIDLAGLRPDLRTATIRIATDVDNPLLGPRGSVVVFGPQKGITADLAPRIEAGLRTVARIVADASGADIVDIAGRPGGGAAGGIAAVFAGLLGARIVPGAALVMDLLAVRERIAAADLVITGEGAFDDQTLHGKGPGAVLDAARSQAVPTAIIAGRIDVDPQQIAALGLTHALALTAFVGGDVEAAIRECLPLARLAGQMIGRAISVESALVAGPSAPLESQG
jgi:glycerate kinase